MNIFVTDECPVKSAQNMCNIHVNKMLSEAAQILSTTHNVLDKTLVGMKPTHHNHPCCVWARKTSGNYEWLFQHYIALCAEYTFRTGKKHGSEAHAKDLAFLPKNIVHGQRTFFVKAMYEEYKRIPNVQKAYQEYLKAKYVTWQTRTDKKQMPVEWGVRGMPAWMEK